jgi:SAM-dependent methyltransferase
VNPGEYAIMYRVEDSHWWYLGMARITRAVLERWYQPGAGLRILDAGCGTGAVMRLLADYGEVTGFDFAAEALTFCRARGVGRLARASIMQLPFPDGRFDLVTSFDVLCERAVPDDGAALREIARVLAPGGRLVLRLPAYDWLRGQHDRAVHIRHRYTARELADRLSAAGLVVDHVSYANTVLFPVAAAKRWLERVIPPRDGTSDLTLGVGPFNGLLRRILGAEARWVARSGLPFGLTVVAVGRRP